MKYHKLVENAAHPNGFWGKMMIKSMNKNHSQLTDWALDHIKINKTDIILDVGCGGGRTVDKLCSFVGNGKVFGIDYSELCVKKSEKFNRKNILCNKAKIIQSTVSELPFEDEKFNYVIAVETFYFWPDKINDLREIYRTLKHGGKILLVFEMVKKPEEPEKWEKIEKRLGINAVSKEEITDFLLRSGYQDIRSYVNSSKNWLCLTAEKE